MATESPTDDRIDLPTEFAHHLATVGNLDTTPDTLADYWSTFADHLAASDRTLTSADLYADAPTRHEVHVDDRVRYAPCVLDALVAAVLTDEYPTTVRSVDPETDVPVTLTVHEEGVDATPETAVVSFGIAPTIPALDGTDESVFEWLLEAEDAGVSGAFCQYINAFESEDSYEQWVSATDGETIPVEPTSVDALIRRFLTSR